jgi:hypothetical protein
VLASFNRLVALPAALGAMAALCACSSFDTSSAWFAKPIDVFGTRMGYSYADLGDTRRDRPITANDLVDANGGCAGPVTALPPGAAQDNASAGGGDAAALLGGGVAIGMSECDVVQRLGQPNSVTLGQNPNGLRGAVLTYSSGPRPGVYRFEAGRLTEMDRVEQPPQPEQKAPPKKVAKKKPPPEQPAPQQPAKNNGNS